MMRSFTKTSLRFKGMAIVAVAVFSLICTSFIARSVLSHLSGKLLETADVLIPQLQEISETTGLLKSAHLEVVRTSALANAGLSGAPMERQFAAATAALAQVQQAYDATETVPEGSIIEATQEIVSGYLSSATSALEMLAIEPMTGSILINQADDQFVEVVEIANVAAGASRLEVDATSKQTVAEADRAKITFLIIAAASIALCLIVTSSIIRSITGPIRGMTENMRSLAEGNLEVEIEGTDAPNEIGQMATALDVFRENAKEAQGLRIAREKALEDQARIEKEALEAENTQKQQDAERIRSEQEVVMRRAAQSKLMEDQLANVISAAEQGDFTQRMEDSFQEKALSDVAVGVNSLLSTVDSGLRAACGILKQLSTGNLSVRMEGDFRGAFAELQDDTNLSAQQFEEAIIKITSRASGVLADSSEIAAAANSLSERTEKTAASLEETSAAIEEVTISVQSAAGNAQSAKHLVLSSLSKADESEAVVNNAIAAMAEISTLSDEISEAVTMINKIAFQTNLLALNAGVEAARAGESGRGFSVVASEVRALAVQAATSAGEIETLISRSSEQVRNGVNLVSQTGKTISEMSLSIKEVTENVSQIAQSAAEQADSISNVNVAINEIDRATQQNAAMFEETTAASHSLSSAAEELTDLALQFSTKGSEPLGAAA
jgi:methyl-accepting chemotaxis protein